MNPSSGRNVELVTPSDTVDIGIRATGGLYVGGVGNIRVLAVDDAQPILLTAVPAGTLLPIQARRVFSTGTTATLIVAIGQR